ncbi:MAG: DMT family transporter [Porticoccaceae bacterium]|jgi:drug/metabolite transporter (DMT)-like permease|nr:DMT family transporter [Porticoccaceae bacterium]
MVSTSPAAAKPAPLPNAIAVTLLLFMATLFASNHIAARIAFDNNTGLLLAILLRSAVALVFMVSLTLWQRNPLRIPRGRRRWQLLLGLFIAGQSLCLYSAIANIPVAMALLLVNTWPIFFALITWALGGSRPSGRMTILMAIILVGLVLVLDIPRQLSTGDAWEPQWLPGILFALIAGIFFASAVWITENRLAGMAGSVRSTYTMAIVLLLMALGGSLDLVPGGLQLPANPMGWLGLALLALFYGLASTVLFVLMPRLNMAQNAPAMNFEPVASLLLGYVVLAQVLTPMQLTGGAIVLGGILWMGLSNRAR